MRFLLFSLTCLILATQTAALERTVNNQGSQQVQQQTTSIAPLLENLRTTQTSLTEISQTVEIFNTCAQSNQVYNSSLESCVNVPITCAEITVRDLMDNIGPENTIRGYTSTSGPKGGTIPERTQGEIVTVRTGTGRCDGGSTGGSIVYERDFICIMGNVVLASNTKTIDTCEYPDPGGGFDAGIDAGPGGV